MSVKATFKKCFSFVKAKNPDHVQYTIVKRLLVTHSSGPLSTVYHRRTVRRIESKWYAIELDKKENSKHFLKIFYEKIIAYGGKKPDV